MDKIITLKDNIEMVLIQEGDFTFGVSDEELLGIYTREADVTRHRSEFRELLKEQVSLKNFYIDKFPVTNDQFRRFMVETNYHKRPHFIDTSTWGAPHQPIVGIDWEDATAYAEWTGKRLPTEKEWEKAARGTDGRLFPWGNDLGEIRCNCFEAGLRCTSEVGSFPDSASPFGVQDMAGNVWEMTTDHWDEQSLAMRGGAYLTYQYFCRVTARWAPSAGELKEGAPWLGFRCVYTPA